LANSLPQLLQKKTVFDLDILGSLYDEFERFKY